MNYELCFQLIKKISTLTSPCYESQATCQHIYTYVFVHSFPVRICVHSLFDHPLSTYNPYWHMTTELQRQGVGHQNQPAVNEPG